MISISRCSHKTAMVHWFAFANLTFFSDEVNFFIRNFRLFFRDFPQPTNIELYYDLFLLAWMKSTLQ